MSLKSEQAAALHQFKRSIAGAEAAHRGKAFESALESTHRAYREHGLAFIQQLPVPTRYVGNGIFKRAARQGYDYYGMFGPNAAYRGREWLYHGRAIAMEAKSNRKHKASLPIVGATRGGKGVTGGSGISIHQLAALADAYSVWGAAAVIVWQNGADTMLLTPDELIAATVMYQTGTRKSIPVKMFTSLTDTVDWLYELRLWIETNGLPSPSLSAARRYQMVHYRVNFAKQEITVDVNGKEVVVKTAITDIEMLNEAAAQSATPEAFIKAVDNLQIANE